MSRSMYKASTNEEGTMRKVKLHPLILELHGTIDGMVFKMSPKGNMIITKCPDMSKVKWSKAQKAQRKRFKLAVAYAKAALAEPKVRARYDKQAKRQNKR